MEISCHSCSTEELDWASGFWHIHLMVQSLLQRLPFGLQQGLVLNNGILAVVQILLGLFLHANEVGGN